MCESLVQALNSQKMQRLAETVRVTPEIWNNARGRSHGLMTCSANADMSIAPTLMVPRSMLGVRASMPARLTSAMYDRGVTAH